MRFPTGCTGFSRCKIHNSRRGTNARPMGRFCSKKNGLEKNVLFMGFVSTHVKHEILHSCTALVLPSRLEGFGGVIIEAFGMHKPVLVADLKSETEIVDNGIDGFLIPPDDVENWAEKIKYLFSDRERCQAMGRNGRSKVESKFDLSLISNSMERVYEEVVSSTPMNGC